ncbi:hypothetical protein HYH03_010892 [Edaphochlamys debaryana]|uniref:NFX1-type zinc finger-containing protein 1 n=1 Tax=Edaphochlamys debaryana TaxID=47281 RepID=A0A836BW90_9CHLO|nr:hypothetical protein HYH03_010892 [Edaphochlamys debaryana]|eukprot:KAG2490737.1 hypothetical protein HYH03_010892 [Edaphochlamys debaryana]
MHAGQFGLFLGSALACLSDPAATDAALDRALQAVCGVPPPPPRRGTPDGGGGTTADPPAAPANARAHLALIMQTLRDRHALGKLTAQVWAERGLPLLRLLSHPVLRGSLRTHWVDPLYDSVLHSMDWGGLVAVYRALAEGAMQAPRFGAAPELQGGALCWAPQGWLDVLEPPAQMLQELLQRFRRPKQREPLTAPLPEQQQMQVQSRPQPSGDAAQAGGGAAQALAAALGALCELHVGDAEDGSGGAPAGSGAEGQQADATVRARRLRETLRAVDQQLRGAQQPRREPGQHAETGQRRYGETVGAADSRGDRAAEERLRDPHHLPGELRPGRPRHDNDCAAFTAVRVVPTAGELLCPEPPYLPSNRPGSMPHLSHDPTRARLEVNFRLLRHGVVAPLSEALLRLLEAGGLARLGPTAAAAAAAGGRSGPSVGAADRLRLERGVQVFAFRDARFEGLEMTRQEGAVVKVSFEQPASALRQGGGSRAALADWWERSRRLAHGTLLCFWWEPRTAAAATGPAGGGPDAPAAAGLQPGAQAAGGAGAGGAAGPGPGPAQARDGLPPAPCLVVGVVAQREARDLALVHASDYEQLLGAWLEAAGGSGGEVVLVQEHNAWFAYEPLLRALQGMTSIPLARHLVPGFGEPPPPRHPSPPPPSPGLQPPPRPAASALAASPTSPPVPTFPVLVSTTPTAPTPTAPSLPAYLADRPLVDLRHVADRDRVLALPLEERAGVLRALAAVDLSPAAGARFPTAQLLAATTLDPAQAEALRAALSQEVAVVQGPPGTGKTFLGVVLTRALLCNTCNSRAAGGGDQTGDGGGGSGGGGREGPNDGPRRRPSRPAPAPRTPPPAPELPEVDLLDSGVTDSVVRVGGSSRSERLQAYNLRNLQDKVGGPRLALLYRRMEELQARARRLSAALRELCGGEVQGCRALRWEELEPLLRERHPRLWASFRRGMRRWNRAPRKEPSQPEAPQGAGEEAAATDGSAGGGAGGGGGGVPDVGAGGSRATSGGSPGGGACGSGGSGTVVDADGFTLVGRGGRRARFADLVSHDWLRSSPERDWTVGRLRTAAGAGAGGLTKACDDGAGEERWGDSEEGSCSWSGDEEDEEEDEGEGAVMGAAAAPGHSFEEQLARQRALQAQAWARAGGWAADGSSPLDAAGPSGGWAGMGDSGGGGGGSGPMAAAAGLGGADAQPALPLTPGATAPAEGSAGAGTAWERLERELRAAQAAEAAAAPSPQARDGAGRGGGSSAVEEAVTGGAESQQTGLRQAAGVAGARHGSGRPGAVAAAAPAEVWALCEQRRPLEELLECGDVWSMSHPERRQLHAHLLRLRYLGLLGEARAAQGEHEAAQRELQAEYDTAALETLRRRRVVGMTTSGVARLQHLVGALGPKVLLVEEAAEVYEAHVIACLSRGVEHVVLMGDHEQLRPKPDVYELQAVSGSGLDLDVSLFERLVARGGFPVAALAEQRRMRPQISRLIRDTIYPQLRDHPRVLAYPPLRGLAHSLFFLDHAHPEAGAGGEGGAAGGGGEDRSKSNEWEAALAVALARHFLLQGYAPEDLVILVTYAGQLHRVRAALAASNLRVLVGERDREQMDPQDDDPEGDEGDTDPARPQGARAASAAATVALLPADARALPLTSTTLVATGREGGGRGGNGGGGARGSGRGARGGQPSAGDGAAGRAGGRGQARGPPPAGAASGNAPDAEGEGGGGGEGAGGGVLAAGQRVVSMQEGIRVATVDNFQGEEATIIILSTVRCNDRGSIGFLSMRNRVNVMLSRARHGAVVLGSAATLRAGSEGQRGAVWPAVLDMMQADGCLGPHLTTRCANHGAEAVIRDPGDFARLSPDGGCALPCGQALPCGHACPRRCHADDPDHAHAVCAQPCERRHEPCGHPCERSCGEACGRCGVALAEPFQLGCGHMAPAGTECWRRHTPGGFTCTAPVEVTLLACGHTLTLPCWEVEDALAGRRPCSNPCPAPCGAVLRCGHACGAECGACVRRVLRGGFVELVEGFVRHLPPDLQETWRCRGRKGGPATAGEEAGAAAAASAPEQQAPVAVTALAEWMRFVGPEGAGGAQRDAWLGFLRARLQRTEGDNSAAIGAVSPHASLHSRCTRRCRRPLPCGHPCGAACHGPLTPCRAACERPCWVHCAHRVCRRPCAEPCAPCAQPCVLPCDARCAQRLPCGHRCPGLCGEPCPPPGLCLEPDCLARADEGVLSMVVDPARGLRLRDLSPAHPDCDPLVALRCGHALLRSALDAAVGLEGFYRRGPNGDWLHPLPLPLGSVGACDVKPRCCPHCREPISGVLRYGRAINAAAAALARRRHMGAWGGRLAEAQARLGQLLDHVTSGGGRGEGGEGGGSGGGGGLEARLGAVLDAQGEQAQRQQGQQGRGAGGQGGADVHALLEPVAEAQRAAVGVLGAFQQVAEAHASAPTRAVYEAAASRLLHATDGLQHRREAVAAAMEHAGSAASGGDADAAETAAAAAAATAAAEAAGGDAQSIAAAAEAEAGVLRERLAVARRDVAVLRPDASQLGSAWAGVLACAEAYTAAACVGVRWCGRLLEALGPGADPGSGPGGGRQSAALQAQARQLLLPALAVAGPMLAHRLPAWRGEAAGGGGACEGPALALSAAGLRLGLARVRTEAQAALALHRGVSGSGGEGRTGEHLRALEAALDLLERSQNEMCDDVRAMRPAVGWMAAAPTAICRLPGPPERAAAPRSSPPPAPSA